MVYETMLRAPSATSIRAIADATTQNRGTVFEIIKKLLNLGLVGCNYRNKRKHYFAKSPSTLRSFANVVRDDLVAELGKVDAYVNELEAIGTHYGSQQFTQFYDGEDEIAVLLRDLLLTVEGLPEKTYRVVSSAEVRNHLYGKFRNFTRQRIQKKISVRVIGVGELGDLAEFAQVKLLTSHRSPESYIIVYGDKVAHISLNSFAEVRGVLIQNKGVADLHGLLFDSLWDSLPETVSSYQL